MNCWHCQTKLIWGGDQSIDENCLPHLQDDYSMITNLSCPKCHSDIEVLMPKYAYD